MKKLFFILLCVFVVAGSLSARGRSESSDTVTLTVLWFNDANESDVFMETIQGYLDENPNVRVDLQIIPFNDYEQRLRMMISGGTAPDLARITTAIMPGIISTLEPIDPYLENPEATKASFMPSMLAFTLNDSGQMLAYPTEATANGMLVNLTAWENAGIDVRTLSQNWTWDEWEEAVKQVIAANANMSYGLAVDYTIHRFSTMLYEFGGSFLNDDQSAFQMDKPENVNAINYFKHLHDEGIIPNSVWMGSENPAELFQAGLVACHIGGSWNINTYNTNVTDFEWCVVSTPKAVVNSSVPGGKFIGAFRGGRHMQEAMDLMAYFSAKEQNEQYCLGTFNLSSRLDAEIEYPTNTEDFAVFQRDLSVTPAFTAREWTNQTVNQLGTYMVEQIVQVLLGNITAEQACQAIQARAGS